MAVFMTFVLTAVLILILVIIITMIMGKFLFSHHPTYNQQPQPVVEKTDEKGEAKVAASTQNVDDAFKSKLQELEAKHNSAHIIATEHKDKIGDMEEKIDKNNELIINLTDKVENEFTNFRSYIDILNQKVKDLESPSKKTKKKRLQKRRNKD